MQVQALLTAAAMNLKQLARRRPKAQSAIAFLMTHRHGRELGCALCNRAVYAGDGSTKQLSVLMSHVGRACGWSGLHRLI